MQNTSLILTLYRISCILSILWFIPHLIVSLFKFWISGATVQSQASSCRFVVDKRTLGQVCHRDPLVPPVSITAPVFPLSVSLHQCSPCQYHCTSVPPVSITAPVFPLSVLLHHVPHSFIHLSTTLSPQKLKSLYNTLQNKINYFFVINLH
jgi:hypothetical protein